MKARHRNKRPILIYTSWLPWGLRGFCLPPFVAVRLDLMDEPWVLRHELAHWVQYRRRGWLRYVGGYLWHYLRKGYWNHSFELEARRRGWQPFEEVRSWE